MRAGDRFAKAGLATLALTIGVVIALLFSVVAGRAAAITAAAVTLLFFVICWFLVPRSLKSSNPAAAGTPTPEDPPKSTSKNTSDGAPEDTPGSTAGSTY